MNLMSFVKRIAPFVLTFAVGLLIASFFVTVAAPSFQFRRGFSRHREMDRQMRMENDRLRDENNRLQKRLAEMEQEKRDWVLDTVEVPNPPAPAYAVPPPPAPPVMPMRTVPSKAR